MKEHTAAPCCTMLLLLNNALVFQLHTICSRAHNTPHGLHAAYVASHQAALQAVFDYDTAILTVAQDTLTSTKLHAKAGYERYRTHICCCMLCRWTNNPTGFDHKHCLDISHLIDSKSSTGVPDLHPSDGAFSSQSHCGADLFIMPVFCGEHGDMIWYMSVLVLEWPSDGRSYSTSIFISWRFV